MTVKNFIKTSRFHLNVLSGGDDNVNGGVKYAFCFFFFFKRGRDLIYNTCWFCSCQVCESIRDS